MVSIHCFIFKNTDKTMWTLEGRSKVQIKFGLYSETAFEWMSRLHGMAFQTSAIGKIWDNWTVVIWMCPFPYLRVMWGVERWRPHDDDRINQITLNSRHLTSPLKFCTFRQEPKRCLVADDDQAVVIMQSWDHSPPPVLSPQSYLNLCWLDCSGSNTLDL